MSVDTYIDRRNTSNYRVISQDGVEVLVSRALLPGVRTIHIGLSELWFLRSLRAELELVDGMVIPG